jgi:quercetin dioxygenase-like cupin family protein
MGAVLEGRFELTCGDERYELAAGMGILIPANEPHVWRVLSDDGVLYRVSKK